MDSTFHVETPQETVYSTITAEPDTVTNWIRNTNDFYQTRSTVVFGLDIEWQPNWCPGVRNPAATLQICDGNHCLIIQLLHMYHIPRSLRRFLTNPRYLFAGVGIESDADKLDVDYGLICENLYDLRQEALQRRPESLSRWPGLKELAREVSGVFLDKPRRVTVSDWGKEVLTGEQIKYACLDAYASSKVGIALYYNLEWYY